MMTGLDRMYFEDEEKTKKISKMDGRVLGWIWESRVLGNFPLSERT